MFVRVDLARPDSWKSSQVVSTTAVCKGRMRIDSKAKIAGHPALSVRELLRRGRTGEWGARFVGHVLKVDQEEAARVLASLHEKGLIEPAAFYHDEKLYRPTIMGAPWRAHRQERQSSAPQRIGFSPDF
ncbi:MAG TPA: hypothetical protein VFS20_02155 [Longimicrobium sp.]|nr:hypothetical protein [Longimicrobium sp.]